MKIYLDNCCFNRPFDDQSQIRIRLESEAKLEIQEETRAGNRAGKVQLIWSYILDYENNKNPYQKRKERIKGWKKYAAQDIQESSELIKTANLLNQKGLQKIDSLHIACAIFAKCEYFLTTDDKILQREKVIDDININDPIGFIKEVLS
ncbi:MAG: PIN domain protein [Deltaproteobacteria bacterium]|nr:PIN domain protein [Deltaproteobacteria bacterium]